MQVDFEIFKFVKAIFMWLTVHFELKTKFSVDYAPPSNKIHKSIPVDSSNYNIYLMKYDVNSSFPCLVDDEFREKPGRFYRQL